VITPARRRRLLLATGAIVLVLVVVLGLVVAKLAGVGEGEDNAPPAAAPSSGTAEADVVADATSVPAAVLDEVGVGTVRAAPQAIDAPPLTEDGKPKILYVGGEFCPFCAAERWALVVALSRFGTWSGLGLTTSAPDDVYPGTATLSFHGADYTSEHLAFTGVETSDRERAPLGTLSAEDQKTFTTYNRPPYVPSEGSVPFLDIAGAYAAVGASYDVAVLEGRTHRQIAAALSRPDDPVAQAVDGSANVLTALVCRATDGEPASVCTAAGVTAADSALGGTASP
jgi:hypothetical protein